MLTQLAFQLNIHSSLYSNWSVSEDVKQIAQFLRTEKFKELLLAWLRAGLEHSSFSILLWFLVLEQKLQIFKIEIVEFNCLPASSSDQGWN